MIANRPLHWTRFMESDLVYCTICKYERTAEGPRRAELTVDEITGLRVRVPVAEHLTRERLSARGKPRFNTAKRAAFRRHVRSFHPSWEQRIAWAR